MSPAPQPVSSLSTYRSANRTVLCNVRASEYVTIREAFEEKKKQLELEKAKVEESARKREEKNGC